MKQQLLSPDPDSNCKPGHPPHPPEAAGNPISHPGGITGTVITSRRDTERNQTCDTSALTLAICSSTMQCLMDSTILWKNTQKQQESLKEQLPNAAGTKPLLCFYLHKSSLSNFLFSVKNRKKEKSLSNFNNIQSQIR